MDSERRGFFKRLLGLGALAVSGQFIAPKTVRKVTFSDGEIAPACFTSYSSGDCLTTTFRVVSYTTNTFADSYVTLTSGDEYEVTNG